MVGASTSKSAASQQIIPGGITKRARQDAHVSWSGDSGIEEPLGLRDLHRSLAGAPSRSCYNEASQDGQVERAR